MLRTAVFIRTIENYAKLLRILFSQRDSYNLSATLTAFLSTKHSLRVKLDSPDDNRENSLIMFIIRPDSRVNLYERRKKSENDGTIGEI